jgi:hypothetical protein
LFETRKKPYTTTLAAIKMTKINSSNKLKQDLDSISLILTIVLQSYEYSKYLYKPNSEEELKFANNSPFFRFTRHTHWRNLVIELAKIISDNTNQSFNIFKLLRKLEKSGDFREFKYSNEKIENWRKELTKHDKTIKEIEVLRNKIYSHTDRNKKEFIENSEIDFQKTENLINLIILIIKDIYAELLDTHAEIRPLNYTENDFNILRILSNERKQRNENRVKKFISEANKNK